MKIQAIRGVKDILPGEIEKWQWVESKAHSIFERYGFREIRPPIFEKTKLFSRGIGESTDIVEKEMYTFEDRSGEKITLRPEGTASVVRAFIEHKLYTTKTVQKLYYLGPMFRYERPQAGRFRQFYQIGVEAMGSHDPTVDAEVMIMLMDFFHSLGLNGLKLQLNSLGCNKCRPEYRKILKQSIHSHLSELCVNCNQRYEKNPLRVLDCKVESDRKIALELPKTSDHLCTKCKDHFDRVRTLLDFTKTPYNLNNLLVRGLDYYSHTTFEVISSNLGAQNAICGGGRYNMLVEEFAGPSTPCFGFALGLERIISIIPFDKSDNFYIRPDVFIVRLGKEAEKQTFILAHQLRLEGIGVEYDYDAGSLKSQMRKANKSLSRFTLIVGDNEIKSGKYQLKNMADGKQVEVASKRCVKEIKSELRRRI